MHGMTKAYSLLVNTVNSKEQRDETPREMMHIKWYKNDGVLIAFFYFPMINNHFHSSCSGVNII